MKTVLLWVRRFVMTYGIIMLCTFFMCLLFNPTSALPVVSFFGKIMIFTLLGLFSLVIYYTKDELTSREWWLRTIIHALVLEVILLPLAHHWGFWHNGPDIFIYAFFILAAKLIWHLVDYGRNAHEAREINERIRKTRLKQKGERNGAKHDQDTSFEDVSRHQGADGGYHRL